MRPSSCLLQAMLSVFGNMAEWALAEKTPSSDFGDQRYLLKKAFDGVGGGRTFISSTASALSYISEADVIRKNSFADELW